MTSDVLTLPAAPPPARRSAFPLYAGLVPLLGGGVLWLATGSWFALLFAALGPVVALGALADGARSARRAARLHRRERAAALERARVQIDERAEQVRDALRLAHPDLAALVGAPAAVWRARPGEDALLVGVGTHPGVLRLEGGDREDPEVRALCSAATEVSDAPLTVPWRRGVVVVGDGARATATLRALVAQLCLRHPPAEVRIVGPTPPEWTWIDELPHRDTRRGESVLPRATGSEPVRVAIRAGGTVPGEADVVFAIARTGEALDPRCSRVLRLADSGEGELEAVGEQPRGVRDIEVLAAVQARAVARVLSVRARAVFGAERDGPDAGPPEVGRLAEAPGVGESGALAVALGAAEGAPLLVDLVADGPHAIVVGVTGSGKSELLRTWITALCAAYPTSALSFLLADFKGGTAFEPLAGLPHVAGVLTDLDAGAAERAISSLRAELRRREALLAEAGLRDVAEGEVPRLVIVVDEFATLAAEHSDLVHVFADIAARGRALGMHLILGTQRAGGVFRDALLGNIGLRIALRAADDADSRLVVGSDAAAQLPGGAAARGSAMVRRAGDAAPLVVRVPQTDDARLRQVMSQRADEPLPRRPWLPPLPLLVRPDDIPPGRGYALGLTDEPEQQRRGRWAWVPERDRALLVVGAAGSGRTALMRLCAQVPGPVTWIPSDPEQGWDALERAAEQCGGVVLADDVDMLLAALPDEYQAVALARLEDLVRRAGVRGPALAASARRLVGPLGRIADLFGTRALLRLPNRAEAIAAGGSTALPDAPPGRGLVDGRLFQAAWLPGSAWSSREEPLPWVPREAVTGVITARPDRLVGGEGDARVIRLAKLASFPVTAVDDVQGWLRAETGAGDEPLVLVGDLDAWQQRWVLLSTLRERHAVLVDVALPTAWRVLSASRELPPFAAAGAGRAWQTRPSGGAHRVRVPAWERGAGAG